MLANAFPAKSFIPEFPPVIVTVYTVDGDNAADGVNVSWLLDAPTVAAITVPPGFFNWKVVVVTVAVAIVHFFLPSGDCLLTQQHHY